jgi:hypothetical protein
MGEISTKEILKTIEQLTAMLAILRGQLERLEETKKAKK